MFRCFRYSAIILPVGSVKREPLPNRFNAAKLHLSGARREGGTLRVFWPVHHTGSTGIGARATSEG